MRRFVFPLRSWLGLLGLGVLLVSGLSAQDEDLDLSLGSTIDNSVGMDWTLADGQLVHLRLVNHQFCFFFLDAERKIVEPVYSRVILRGEETRNKTNELLYTLSRGSGPYLTHPRMHYPPYDYWLMIIIPSDLVEGDDAIVLSRGRFRQ